MLQLKCQQKFSMGSTYDYNKQIENTILQSIPNWIKSKCSIRKIVRTICNLAKINPFQCCLLAWLLTKSKYDIDRISTDSRTKTKIVEQQFDQKILIFILMNAYYTKQFVCEQLEPEIDDQISRHIPNFKHLYNKKFNPQKSLKTLSLTDINKIFNQWTCRQEKKNKIDYNNLVDKILYLSKSYNVSHDQNKSQRLGVPKKKRKPASNADQNQVNNKSQLQSQQNGQKSFSNNFSNVNTRNKGKYMGNNNFKCSHQSQGIDFIGPSQENQNNIFKRQLQEFQPVNQHYQQHFPVDMNQSRRTTRQMLQSVNVFDYIPSQDNLFNSQYSANSVNNLMGSQYSIRNMLSSQQSVLKNEGFQIGSSAFLKKNKSKQNQKDKEKQKEKDKQKDKQKQKTTIRGYGNSMKLKQTESFDQIK